MARKQELESLNSELIDFLTAIRDRIDAKLDELEAVVEDDDDLGEEFEA